MTAHKNKKPVKPDKKPVSNSALLLLLVVLAGLVGLLFYLFPELLPFGPNQTQTNETHDPALVQPTPGLTSGPGQLIITEIQTDNQLTLQTKDEAAPDWIEFHNAGSQTLDLTGYGLSDNLGRPRKWIFPQVSLKPGQYLLVYASGLTDHDPAEIHASFRLAKAGENLVLTSPAGTILSQLEIPTIPQDLSWGLTDPAAAEYSFFADPTPGQPNNSPGYATAEEALSSGQTSLVFNEYVMRQDKIVDLDGDFPDWVEIYNAGSEPVALQGLFLSDNAANPMKWQFPDLTLPAGEYLVVWLSGKEASYLPGQPASLQASFQLGKNDTELLLADERGRPLLRLALEQLPRNVSLGRSLADPAVWLYYPSPTPGSANSSQGFPELDGALSLSARDVWINEVLALSATIKSGKKSSAADWVELYNNTDQALDLTGYGLSDDAKNPFREPLDGLIIPAHDYLLLEPKNFGIKAAGESLQLTGPDGIWLDRFATGALSNNVSSGRPADLSQPADSRLYFEKPSPGQANTGPALAGQTPPPQIRATLADGREFTGLYAKQKLSVYLEAGQADTKIYYTLDGSQPSQSSHLYQEPLQLEKTTVLRCLALRPDSLVSQESTASYLFTEKHDLPVLSVLGEAADLFSASGIFTNFNAKIEKPVLIDFYEADGSKGIDFTAGLELHGSYSRKEKQKSFELKIRSLYGDHQVTYPFFPGNEVQTFKRLILRTSGQDWRYTKLRDIFMTEVIRDYTAQDTMAWRPCVVYINGEYFGLYNLREKVDQFYMASHHGADPDNVDIIKGNKIIMQGSYDDYGQLLSFVKSHDLRDEAAYQHVLAQIDKHSLMDFVITQTFFNNLDSGNKKFWREKTEEGRWRWVFFDLDWAMFPSTYKINILKNDLLNPGGHGQGKVFDSSLQVKLMQNPAFRQEFIERYAWYLNNVFTTDRMLAILDDIIAQIESEMPRQIARWGGPPSLAYWQDHVSQLRRITTEKRQLAMNTLQSSFALSQTQMKELFSADYP